MSEFTKALLVANVYRYLLIGAGVAFAYMGYRLFFSPLWAPSFESTLV